VVTEESVNQQSTGPKATLLDSQDGAADIGQ
jgi:hypothetical protein